MNYDKDTVKAWAGDSQWRMLRADLARFQKHGYSGWLSEGFWALVIFRLQTMVHVMRPKWLWLPLRIILAVVKKLFTLVTHMSLDVGAKIGPGLLIPHLGPIRVHESTKIGADCSLYHLCTIGAGKSSAGATIGDHVFISCSSTIIGKVVIGDGATISANTLVITDVPAGATAIGVPAKIIPAFWQSRPVNAPEPTQGPG
jgi:serine O-acetyltransferase